MTVKLLTEHLLKCLSLKGGCTDSSESTLVKMPHCWKSYVAAYIHSPGTGHGFIIKLKLSRHHSKDMKCISRMNRSNLKDGAVFGILKYIGTIAEFEKIFECIKQWK